MVRRKRNKIEALTNEDGNSITDPNQLRDMAVDFFQKIYTRTEEAIQYHVRDAFPRLPAEELLAISKPFEPEEFRTAVFSMGALKAPGPDGLNPLFFQSSGMLLENRWSNSFSNASRLRKKSRR